MIEFQPHGSFRLSIDGPLLVIEAEGPWNLELLRQYEREAKPYAEALGRAGRWVLLAIMHRSALFCDDAVEALRSFVIGQEQNFGRAGTAIVIAPGVEGYRIIHPVYERVYGGSCPFAVFETRAEAERWAHALLGSALPLPVGDP